MLRNNFYTKINSEEIDAGKVNSTLLLNTTHPIFEGHFPGMPIVPGICMMQIVKEMIEDALGKNLTMVSAGNIKFVYLIDPLKTPQINVGINFSENKNHWVEAEGNIISNGTVFFKIIKAIYK